MNRRYLGILLISSVVFLVISGFLMYLSPYRKSIASLHTFFGIFISVLFLLHILNNRRMLFNYISGKGKELLQKFIGIVIIIGILIIGILIYIDFPYTNALYNAGIDIKNAQLNKSEITFDYDIIDFRQESFDYNITVDFKSGKSFGHPIFAIWLEDSLDNYLQTLYISKSIANSTFKEVIRKGKKWVPGIVRRPEALPHWSHKRNIIASDGLLVPLGPAADLDGVTGATPKQNFEFRTSNNIEDPDNLVLKLELNQSFDWNEFYTKNLHPEDEIYSGPGNVGQPALVYKATIDEQILNGKKHYIMQLAGHSHYSGRNGNIYSNIDSLTTALQIADRILVSIEKIDKSGN